MNEPKTVAVATYPDGHKVRIVKVAGLGWQWHPNCYSSHHADAVANAEREGATVTREPNPKYRPRLSTFERLTKGSR